MRASRLTICAVLLTAAMFVAGCGSGSSDGDTATTDSSSATTASTPSGGGDDGTTGSPPPSNAPDAPPPAVREGDVGPSAGQVPAALTVTVSRLGSGDAKLRPSGAGVSCKGATCTVKVTCPQDAEGPAKATCTWLAAEGAARLTETPDPGRVCTQQYGGPQRALVRGTVDGADVNRTYARNDGCAIHDWERVQQLWMGGVVSPNSGQAT